MPARDKTGPRGRGPRTGRGLGDCKIDGKKYSFFQGPDRSKNLQRRMGQRLKDKGTIKSFRVRRMRGGYSLFVR